MSFRRVRKIGNGHYLYEEHRYREGGKVRSKSIFLGVVGGILEALLSTPSTPEPAQEIDRSVAGHASEHQDMLQGYEQLQAREAEKAAPAEAPAAPADNAGVSGDNGGKDGGQDAPGGGDAGDEGS